MGHETLCQPFVVPSLDDVLRQLLEGGLCLGVLCRRGLYVLEFLVGAELVYLLSRDLSLQVTFVPHQHQYERAYKRES